MKEKILKACGFLFLTTISLTIAWLITKSIGADISSLEIFKPTDKKGDFRITDIYNAVEKNNYDAIGGAPLSDHVIVVSVDNLNRLETLNAINKVVQCNPAAIGLDFPFEDSVLHRDYLLHTVLFNDTIVSATKVEFLKGSNYFRRKYLSFYEKEFPSAHVGYVNIDADYTWNVIRTFHPFVLGARGDTLNSMVLELAKLANPERAQKLLSRHNETEIIDFVSYRIEVIPSALLDCDDIVKRIEGKAVLLGDTAYAPDVRITPLHEPMSGIMVHAYALQTVLEDSYIDYWSSWKIWLISLMLTIAFLFILWKARGKSDSGNWIIRMSQFLIMFLLVLWGCYEFSVHHEYADFTMSITILGFSALTFDLAFALIGLGKWCIAKTEWIKNRINSRKKK